jgi:hypothetical protein
MFSTYCLYSYAFTHSAKMPVTTLVVKVVELTVSKRKTIPVTGFGGPECVLRKSSAKK